MYFSSCHERETDKKATVLMLKRFFVFLIHHEPIVSKGIRLTASDFEYLLSHALEES